MLTRQLEPEVMDTVEEAVDYDSMDHSHVNRVFVDDLLALLDASAMGRSRRLPETLYSVLDVGTGTAQIPIELARRKASVSIVAVDLAEEMLKLGRQNVVASGFADRIRLDLADAKGLPYDDNSFDAVISNSIIHHAPEPLIVMSEMLRVLKPGGAFFVRDLLRPQSSVELQRLVFMYAGEENEHQQQMFRDSLHAALSLDELRELMTACQQPAEWVKQTTDRHWTIAGCVEPRHRSR